MRSTLLACLLLRGASAHRRGALRAAAREQTAAYLAQRRDAFVRGVSTSHWPHEFAAAGVGLPDAPDNDPDAISPEQRRLIGYDRPALGCAVM